MCPRVCAIRLTMILVVIYVLAPTHGGDACMHVYRWGNGDDDACVCVCVQVGEKLSNVGYDVLQIVAVFGTAVVTLG